MGCFPQRESSILNRTKCTPNEMNLLYNMKMYPEQIKNCLDVDEDIIRLFSGIKVSQNFSHSKTICSLELEKLAWTYGNFKQDLKTGHNPAPTLGKLPLKDEFPIHFITFIAFNIIIFFFCNLYNSGF